MLLSTCLAGNAFASDFTTGGFFSFFDDVVKTIVSTFLDGDPCEGRTCTNCKPGTGNAEGTCRPSEN